MTCFNTHIIVGLLCVASLLAFSVTDGSGEVLSPMCSEVIGFAGEHNNHIRIDVPASPADKEAIVLIARAFPLNVGELVQKWIQMNATYRMREGETISSLSNNDGILVIHNVEAGTSIDVKVKRVRKDGPVPFRFWSFHANRPSCYIDVSPTNSFLAPIPTRVSELVSPVKVYFKSVAPQGAKGFMVDAIFGYFATSAVEFEVMSAPQKEYGARRTSGEVVPWSEGVVYMAFNPPTSTDSSKFLQMKIIWLDDITDVRTSGSGHGSGDGGKAPTAYPQNGNETGTNSSGNETFKGQSKEGKKGGWSALGVISLLFFFIALYMIIMSAVNYHLKSVRRFPEMIPFIDYFRTCGQYFSLVKDGFRRGGGLRGGYSDLTREEMSTDNI